MFFLGICVALLLGASIGSYTAARVFALPHEHTRTRSACSRCHHVLGMIDLIPILSGLLLRGRCRYCRDYFGYRHVSIEATMALTWVITFVITYPATALGSFVPLFTGLLIATLGVRTSSYDLMYRQFPVTGLTIGTTILYLLHWWMQGPSDLLAHLLSSALLMSILGSMVLLGKWKKQEWMGEGDLYLGLFLGSIFPPLEATIILTTGSMLGVLIALGLLSQQRITSKTALPFAPFLMLSAWVGFLILQ